MNWRMIILENQFNSLFTIWSKHFKNFFYIKILWYYYINLYGYTFQIDHSFFNITFNCLGVYLLKKKYIYFFFDIILECYNEL